MWKDKPRLTIYDTFLFRIGDSYETSAWIILPIIVCLLLQKKEKNQLQCISNNLRKFSASGLFFLQIHNSKNL